MAILKVHCSSPRCKLAAKREEACVLPLCSHPPKKSFESSTRKIVFVAFNLRDATFVKEKLDMDLQAIASLHTNLSKVLVVV